MSGERRATVERKTRETDVRLDLALDGTGAYEVDTGVPFFDHMLESFAKHALFDLELRAKGDLGVDLHHTIEDVGIALGQALRRALGGAEGIRRYGFFVLPMAEAKVEVAVDVSSVIRASPDSFRVAWTERRYQDGSLAATERWSAILTIVVQPPRTPDALRKNPLGVFVNALNWSRELSQ